MDRDDTYDQNLDELYEDISDISTPKESKSKDFLTVTVLLVLLLALYNTLGLDVTLGDILNIPKKEEELPSVANVYTMGDNVEVSSNDIDYRLQKGDLLGDIVRDYFKSEYGLEVVIVDTVDVSEGIADGGILKLIPVKDIESGSAYEFRYYRGNGVTNVTDTYGPTLTSKLLGVKLTEHYKDRLPEGSLIWVDSDSLGVHSRVENRDIANVIMNSSIEDLLGYTDEVSLFSGIGLNIVEEQGDVSEIDAEDYVMKYKDILLDIDKVFKKDDISPRLEVVFLNGEQGKINVLSYLEQKIGLTTVGGSFFINWYDEIPMMGEEARNNIIGAMSIKSNITEVLSDYDSKGLKMYYDKVNEKYIPVYSSVSDVMASSIVNEQRSLARAFN